MGIGSWLARHNTELQALGGLAAALVAGFAVFGIVVAAWYVRFKRELSKEAARDQLKTK